MPTWAECKIRGVAISARPSLLGIDFVEAQPGEGRKQARGKTPDVVLEGRPVVAVLNRVPERNLRSLLERRQVEQEIAARRRRYGDSEGGSRVEGVFDLVDRTIRPHILQIPHCLEHPQPHRLAVQVAAVEHGAGRIGRLQRLLGPRGLG